jgi:hypothetical protein
VGTDDVVPTTLPDVPVHEPSIAITPAPSGEEAAAIVAAAEALWPKPMMAVEHDRDRTLAWRFSGRWWQRDRFANSDRPWS